MVFSQTPIPNLFPITSKYHLSAKVSYYIGPTGWPISLQTGKATAVWMKEGDILHSYDWFSDLYLNIFHHPPNGKRSR